MPEIEGRTISTGMKNIDKLLTPEGLPLGTVGVLTSGPISDGFEFISYMLLESVDSSCLITTQRSEKDATDMLVQQSEDDESPQIINPDAATIDNVLSIVQDLDYSATDLVVVDAANQLQGFEDNPMVVSSLREIAKKEGLVFVFHSLGNEHTTTQEPHIDRLLYNANFAFSLQKGRDKRGIRQQLVFEKLPTGSSLNIDQIGVPIVEIPYTNAELSVDDGGRV